MSAPLPLRRFAVAGLATALLAGCAGEQATSPAPPASREAPAADWSPTPVEGVADCATIPTAPRDVSADELPGPRLPCLTTAAAVDLADLGGRPTVLSLWATWCGPCREEMPVLQAASEEYADAVTFVGVNTMDRPGAAAGFLEELGITYPQLVDVEGELLAHTRIKGLPVTLLVDSTGREVGRHIGQLHADQVDGFLAEVTAGR